MNASRILIVAALSAAAFGAQADEADGSQYAGQFISVATRAQVQAQLVQPGANVWSIQYNPLATFKSQRTRAAVEADFLANREAVAALTSEDSGSAFLANNEGVTTTGTKFAGRARNAQ